MAPMLAAEITGKMRRAFPFAEEKPAEKTEKPAEEKAEAAKAKPKAEAKPKATSKKKKES